MADYIVVFHKWKVYESVFCFIPWSPQSQGGVGDVLGRETGTVTFAHCHKEHK